MAYSEAQIKTAVIQSLGASLSVDTAKSAAIDKEIKMAYVEVAQVLQTESKTKDQFNLMWFKLAMYKATIVAIGLGATSEQLYRVYHDFLDLVLENRLPDTETAEPS